MMAAEVRAEPAVYDHPSCEPQLPDYQAVAFRKFVKSFITARTAGSLAKATYASKIVRSAENVLSPQQFAILQMVGVKEYRIAKLHLITGRSIQDLHAMFLSSCEAVKAAYDSEGII